MSRTSLSSSRRVLWALGLVAVLSARAEAPDKVTLPHSFRPVAAVSTANSNEPFVSRPKLTDAETSAPINFEVALKMRSFAELQARVAKGERISPREMAAKYEPTDTNYQQIATWLTAEGLTITHEDKHHVGIFVRGSVAQVQQAMSVSFSRVSFKKEEYTSAVTAPMVPNWMSPLLAGVNGLQPHLRPHKHILKRTMLPDAGGGSAEYKPSQIAAAYNATSLYNSNVTGSGQAIAIVIDTFPLTSDLTLFWQKTGVAQSLSNIQFIQAVAGELDAPSGEETLDTEWASGMAPGANVRVYAATDLANNDLDQTYSVVYDDVINHPEYNIHQMTMSYGEGETYTTQNQVDTDDQYFAELAAAGVTIFASTGDDGSTPDEEGGDTGPLLQAESPATDPNVTAVGGTTLILNASNVVTSEKVWDTGMGSGGAGGGGTSIYFNRPSWQTGQGVNTSARRQTPDISASADPNYGAITYMDGVLTPVGGTSWASPTCAALCALLNEARANSGLGPMGVFGPYLYPQIGTSNIRDITSGNNATPYSGGKYSATVGYDEASGVGTPLAQALAEAVTSSSTIVGVTPSAPVVELTPSQNATFTVSVSGSSASYQWQEMPIGSSTWTNLSDGSGIIGSGTASLTVSNVTQAMSGDEFQCVVTLSSSTQTTAPSVLVVDRPLDVSLLAGDAGVTGLRNGIAAVPQFDYPSGVAVDGSGNIYVADFANNEIREVTPASYVSTPYGSTSGVAGSANGTGNSARFNSPNGVAIDPSGNIYVADSGNNWIRKITGGTVSTFVGSSANLDNPEGVATDSSGNVYIADTNNNIIRKVTPTGSVSTLAGNGNAGFQDGTATGQAEFNAPAGVAVDSHGNVFVADFGNSCVREISGGMVTTVAGQGGQAGYLDGLGSNSLFNAPAGICVDSLNNVYIADALIPPAGSNAAGNNVIRKLSTAGVVSTLAGNPGAVGATNGVGTAAEFYSVQAIAYSGGIFYIADTYNQTIRQATASGKLPGTVTLSNLAATYTGSPQSVAATTNPTGLNVVITYNGSATTPTNAGSYPVIATINDTNYSGSTTGTLVIGKTTGTVTLGRLNFNYSGTSHPATATTTPSGLNVTFTYNGSATAPTNAGAYTVMGTINDPNYAGSATGSEVIIPGSATVTLGDLNFNYNGAAHAATATTLPARLPVTFTYNGSSVAPKAVGSYTVVGTVNTSSYAGSATGTEVIAPIVPTVNTGTASAITATSATLNATSNPETSDTQVYFQYGPTTNYGSITNSDDIGSGSATASASAQATVPAQTAAVTYHYRAVATNIAGPVYGADRTFAALAEPAITTAASTVLSATGAEVSLAVNPNRVATTVYIRYGTTTGYGSVTASQSLGAGTSPVNVFALFPVLAPNTLYYYQLVMVGSGGTFYGPPEQFTTMGFDTTLVAASSTAAPGTGSTFATFGTPVVNAIDGAAFYATLTVGGGVTSTTNDGIWADNSGGTLQLVAQTGSSAPGTAAFFQTLNDPIYNDNCSVAFRGTLKVATGQATAATSIGVWSNDSGSMSLVAREGSAAAGTGSTFSSFTSVGLTASAGAIFYGTLNSGGGITGANNAGIWEGDSAQTLALQLGQVIGGKTITKLTFMPAETYVNGQTRSFNATGDLVCPISFSGGAGFAEYLGGVAQLGRTTGEVADTISGATYSAFGNPAINNNDHLAYEATITGTGITSANNAVVFADNSGGTRTLIAQSGIGTAPGATAMFTAFSDPVINNNEAVAFRGMLKVATGQATSTTDLGIWATGSNASGLALVARQGSAAPGCPTGATFAAFTGLALPDVGGAVILGTLNTNSAAGISSSNNTGIWAVDNNGHLQLIVRTGDNLNGKTVTALSFFPSPTYVNGQDRSFSAATGDLAYLATFSDRSTAIFNVVFP